MFGRDLFGFETPSVFPFNLGLIVFCFFFTSDKVCISTREEDNSVGEARSGLFVGWEDEEPCRARFCFPVIMERCTRDIIRVWLFIHSRIGSMTRMRMLYDSSVIASCKRYDSESIRVANFYDSGPVIQFDNCQYIV